MKIALEVNTNKKAIKPSKNDVIIYDGKEWYVTTKEALFKEYEEKVDAKLKEVDRELQAIQDFKQEVSSQMVEMSKAVKRAILLQEHKGEN